MSAKLQNIDRLTAKLVVVFVILVLLFLALVHIIKFLCWGQKYSFGFYLRFMLMCPPECRPSHIHRCSGQGFHDTLQSCGIIGFILCDHYPHRFYLGDHNSHRFYNSHHNSHRVDDCHHIHLSIRP